MAIKYQMEERIRSMATNLEGDFQDGTKPVLRYSDLRQNSYSDNRPDNSRGGVYDEIQFLRNRVSEPLSESVDSKLSDVRINFSAGESGLKRFDEVKRKWFEENNSG